jgi:hypothetical protein
MSPLYAIHAAQNPDISETPNSLFERVAIQRTDYRHITGQFPVALASHNLTPEG